MHYMSVFYPAADGGYAVEFPDFPEALTQGETLEECVVMAADALALTVEEYARARRDLPVPSTVEQVKALAAREMAESPDVDRDREPFFQMVPAPAMDMTPVKISVSFARSVLEGIDAKARQRGMTRSGFLAAAAQAF